MRWCRISWLLATALLLQTVGTVEAQTWGYCAAPGNYLKLIGGFTSELFSEGIVSASQVGALCHRGMYPHMDAGDITGAWHVTSGGLFNHSAYCIASTTTCDSCIGAPRCLAERVCDSDCACALTLDGANATNAFFASKSSLEFTGACARAAGESRAIQFWHQLATRLPPRAPAIRALAHPLLCAPTTTCIPNETQARFS